MTDLEQKIHEKLLEDLIDKMSDQHGERLKPKGLAVEVAAPDKNKLADGLDKAKDVLGSVASNGSGTSSGNPRTDDDEDGSDAHRLMALLGHGDGDDDEDDRRA